MKVAMVRVGIDTGEGGIHSPLFEDGSFEFIPIPDDRYGVDSRTYGNTIGRCGRPLVDYFPDRRQSKMHDQPMHVDPEFSTFTYGDPTSPKAGLRNLDPCDLLVFYAGLEGWGGHQAKPALYIVGYFEVLKAGYAHQFTDRELKDFCSENFHVRHPRVFRDQEAELVLVKGTERSKLLRRAVSLSSVGHDRIGRPLKVLSPEMQKIFGDFDGRISIQRSPTRWVAPAFIQKAADFVFSLE